LVPGFFPLFKIAVVSPLFSSVGPVLAFGLQQDNIPL